ncbi:MAG: hypothetical protein H6867_11295 [Rhodospirillales bacterium]|nr:hypothetical protein [Rhodospirillales bacterium]MCB9996714.1 hypothetical protein [Rhodospirillales bacterium]
MITANATQAQAQMNSDPRSDFVTQLNESNISDFLAEVSAISTGQRPDMLDDDVVNYFTNHMAPKSKLKSQMRYEIPNFPTQENKMELDREQYISTIVKGRHMMEDYTSTVEIRDLKISGGGKQATFTSIITERGKMPFPKDPKKPDVVDIIPIEGESICEQKLAVSFNNFIQMAGADCQTVIRFDPFGGKPLIPE